MYLSLYHVIYSHTLSQPKRAFVQLSGSPRDSTFISPINTSLWTISECLRLQSGTGPYPFHKPGAGWGTTRPLGVSFPKEEPCVCCHYRLCKFGPCPITSCFSCSWPAAQFSCHAEELSPAHKPREVLMWASFSFLPNTVLRRWTKEFGQYAENPEPV